MSALLSGNRRAADMIPFFSELPPQAVKAACKLWDAIQSPGYNGVSAYIAFTHNLQLHGIEPPPRAIVKRWAAGVECGMIPRPEPEAETPPITETLSAPAVEPDPELQAEVEKVKARATKPKSSRSVSAETRGADAAPAMPAETGTEPPVKQVVDAFVVDPIRSEPVQPEVVLAVDPETRLIADVAVTLPETPGASSKLQARDAVDALVDSLMRQVVAEMMADVEKAAMRQVADMLGQRAADLMAQARSLRVVAENVQGGAA